MLCGVTFKPSVTGLWKRIYKFADTKLFLTQFLFAFIDDLLCCKMSSFAPRNTLLPSHKKKNLQEQFLKFISGGKPETCGERDLLKFVQ